MRLISTNEPKKKVVLITGASGWLGQFVWQRFKQEYSDSMISEDLYFDNSGIELFGTYANHKPKWIPEEFARKMDVQDEQEVTNVIAELRPDIIIHLAAISFPNVCEKDPARGERVNNPPAFIAALKTYVPKAVVVFTSSALVYDGEYAPYKPDFDTTAVPPICAYGVSKLKAEEIVLSSMPNAVVLRLSNLLGPSCVYRHGEYKFMEWLYAQFKDRKYMDFRHDEIRSFVYVNDVVDAIANIVSAAVPKADAARDTQAPSVDLSTVFGERFNVGGPRGLSRLDIATLVAESCGVEAKIDGLYSEESMKESACKEHWKIYKSSNIEGWKSSGVHNPRDGTLDVSLTEDRLGVKFTDMRDAVPKILSHFQKTKPMEED